MDFSEISKKQEKEERIRKALSNYFKILNSKKLPRFKLASLIDAFDGHEDLNSINLGDMWLEHYRLLKEFNKQYSQKDETIEKVSVVPNYKINNKRITSQKKPGFSFLDLKIRIASELFKECRLCEKRCMVNRNMQTGECGVLEPKISSEFLHVGEEAQLVPSHTIFFAGCTLNCVFCQNWDISQNPNDGVFLSPEKLAEIIDNRHLRGSKNVNFVGGEPTPQIYFILQTMNLCNENIPIIWNSNFHMSKESMELLNGFVDLYLSDFKFGNDDCASRLSGGNDYWHITTRNHLLAKKSGDLIIRHLLLPGHFECCTKPILKWIYENLGSDIVVNIMGQYRPVYQADKYPEISRSINRDEIIKAIQYGEEIGLENII
ncbi:radical SAM protein [Methanobacterium alcaliphilum]|uniref:radical SAM protein n=1 Tax=Methanobacterium alcaliphilum TaxID=392018 RepID=UPI00200B8333|nr:radical SAM protein [Methanobacterium alcaliphilum]MCK9150464.1 radical SAM protein [Methanobacterium alcaliphilum]